MAWVYRAYSNNPELMDMEAEAMADRRGLWADQKPVPPWEFRRE
jgi:endonuclease YncB( thermonuclease family)